jgi:hypothetical protein
MEPLQLASTSSAVRTSPAATAGRDTPARAAAKAIRIVLVTLRLDEPRREVGFNRVPVARMPARPAPAVCAIAT